MSVGDLLVEYLHRIGVDYVFGIPGGAIEPLFDSLARSERKGQTKVIVSRHETGAAFMADGYTRVSGKLGVCCATTGPGATNLITGVATAYENHIPMLVITAQTALSNFGRCAFQESSDTGVNVVGMLEYCTVYNTMISHVNQLEQKLFSAVMMATSGSRPAHLSIPVDVLRQSIDRRISLDTHRCLTIPLGNADKKALDKLCENVTRAKKVVFIVGVKCYDAISVIEKIAFLLNAQLVTTPDGMGLVSVEHPLYRGGVGFAGHTLAHDTLLEKDVDLVIAAGTTLGEWSSNGWDWQELFSHHLIHIDSVGRNLTHSPMAKLHVCGDLTAIFEFLLIHLQKHYKPKNVVPNKQTFKEYMDSQYAEIEVKEDGKVKPQLLMAHLPELLPIGTGYFADTGNSMAWAIHFLNPRNRRIVERRGIDDEDKYAERLNPGRRRNHADLFQVTIEFSSMGWAIGAAVGAALSNRTRPIVCITGDGSMLMNGSEVTVALQHNLSVIFVVLNDNALGMVKHGQVMASAESIGTQLPSVNFAKWAHSMGIKSYRIESCKDLFKLDFGSYLLNNGPVLLDVMIDENEVPPIGSRVKTLKKYN